jgi:integrase
LAQIWEAAELLGYPFGPYIRLLALTAQRRTEAAGMRWADLDLSTATWTIPAADTKGERRHHVPLTAAAVKILAALPRLGAFVFTTDGRTHMTNYANLKAKPRAGFMGRRDRACDGSACRPSRRAAEAADKPTTPNGSRFEPDVAPLIRQVG